MKPDDPANELLPCPWCGSAADASAYPFSRDSEQIRCSDAHNDCKVRPYVDITTMPEAITAWNRRALASAEPVAWTTKHELAQCRERGTGVMLANRLRKDGDIEIYATPQPRAVDEAMVDVPDKAFCHWEEDETDGSWATDCGNRFQFEAGTPDENGFIACCYCGSPLIAMSVEYQNLTTLLVNEGPGDTK